MLNKDLSKKQRKIAGISIIALGITLTIKSFLLGAIVILIGMWVLNPEKKS
jgi:hypothetical protein